MSVALFLAGAALVEQPQLIALGRRWVVGVVVGGGLRHHLAPERGVAREYTPISQLMGARGPYSAIFHPGRHDKRDALASRLHRGASRRRSLPGKGAGKLARGNLGS